MARVVANMYEDTRALLNKVKEEFEFKSDDQAIKYLCTAFLSGERSKHISQYLWAKKREQEG